MDFTVHSIKDIESWFEIHRTTGMDIDLHFHVKRSPDIPGEDSLIDIPFKNTKGEPFDWIKEKETDRYIWKDEVTSEQNTPDGYDYIGSRESDVWKDYQNRAPNGLSRLYRKYMGAPDIDRTSFVDARNEDVEKLVKEVFDAIKNRVDRINENFEPINLSNRGSGQYYGFRRNEMEHGKFGITLELEYEGIIFTSQIGFHPLDPKLSSTNNLSHLEKVRVNENHSNENVFIITSRSGFAHPRLYIQMDRDAFRQIYKELMGEDHRFFK